MSNGPYELPGGWKQTTLEEVCSKITDGTHKTPTYVDNGVRFISIKNIRPFESINWDNYKKFIPHNEHKELIKRCNPEVDDIIFPRIGTLGFAKRIDFTEPVSLFVGLGLAKPLKNVISPRYLEYWMNSSLIHELSYTKATGTGRKTLPLAESKKFPILLPPLNEQRRIVAKIEDLLSQVNTSRERLAKVPEIMKQFRQSVLAAAFSGRLTEQWRKEHPAVDPASVLLERIVKERKKKLGKKYKEPSPIDTSDLSELPEGWEWTKIGQIETFMGSGITPRGGKSTYLSEGIPFIRSQNVWPYGLKLDNIAYISEEQHEKMSRTKVHPLDVLLNITGASIGRSTYVPGDFPESNVNQHVCIIRTPRLIYHEFLSSFLNSPIGQDEIFSTQSGVTREGLNYTQIRGMRMPLPPQEEQQEIVRQVDSLFKQADEIGKQVATATQSAEQITQSILAKAFSGELVPQDPNDEPASVLLERIKAKREKQKKVAKKAKVINN